MSELARKLQHPQQQLHSSLLTNSKKNISALNLSASMFMPESKSLHFLNSKVKKNRPRDVAPLIHLSQTVNHLNTSGFMRGLDSNQYREKKQMGKFIEANTARFNTSASAAGLDENLFPPVFLDDALTTPTMHEDKQRASRGNSIDTRGNSLEGDSRKTLEKQIQHLKKMNEYFQITLKKKDQIYKAIVVDNIKLKHQIQLLEQQIQAKQISQEQNLLFKTQKSLLVETLHSQKLNATTQFTSPKRTSLFSPIKLLNWQKTEYFPTFLSSSPYYLGVDHTSSNSVLMQNNINANQQVKSIQSTPSMIVGFKPPRLSSQYPSDLPEQIVHSVRTSIQGRRNTSFKGVIQRKKVVVIDEEKQQMGKSPLEVDEENGEILGNDQTNENATLFRVSTFFQANDSEGRPLPLESKNNTDDSQNNNYLSLRQDKLVTEQSPKNPNHLSVGNRSSTTPSVGFLSETSVKNTFEQLPDDDQINSQSELKSVFVSHSTDFAFVTQLLDLKSKSADNLKLYTDNKWITHMRSILNDERTLKRTILHLSKGSFSSFYESLLKTLESSDLFFHLTNKLKSIVSAIIKINIQVESSNAFSMIVKETCMALNCDRASVFLVNGSTNELWTKVAKGTGVIKVPFGQGLVGYVANSLKPLNILDAHKDSRFNPEIDKKNNYHTQSVLCMPVIDSEKGTLLGVVQAINKIDGFFTKDDEGCLQIMAVHAMNVLRHSLSNDENQKSQNIVKNLLEMLIKLSKYNDIQKMLPKTTELITRYFDVPEVKLFLLDELKNKIYFYSSEGERIEFNRDCGLIGFSIQSGTEQNIDSAYNHTSFNKLVDIDTSMPVSVYIIWDNPMKKTQILGALEIVNFNGINNISLSKSSKTSFKFDKQIKTFCEIVGAKIKQLLTQQIEK